MSGKGEDALACLQRIEGLLRVIVARLPEPGKEIASDEDLDSKYGDPEVKLTPRDWTGDSFKGLHMSQCPARFLEMLAEMFDYFAVQAEKTNKLTTTGKPVAPYNRRDAARARGWAKRVRAGHVSAPPAAFAGPMAPSPFNPPQQSVSEFAAGFDDGDPIPF